MLVDDCSSVGSWRRVAGHVVAGLVVAAGLLAQVLRPVAPDLGPPLEPTRWFDAAYLRRAHAYSTPLYTAGVLAVTVTVLVPLAAAGTRTGRRLTDRMITAVGGQRPARAAAAVVVATVALTDVVLAPVAFWAGYLHEGTYGLRTQGIGGWAYD
ncbi:MAG: hypothetical protein M3N52_10930, partial [Actinomycetota bacterium]|nr:hypothetical protein [Actinomycetota bacterium]